MSSIEDLKKWFCQHRTKIREDYFQFLRFRSISTDPSERSSCYACAKWLVQYIKQGGLHAEMIETPGLPLVYAEAGSAVSGKNLLCYGHYDVQPVDPLELWKSPPFEPTERDGSIFARGALDDKGQIFFAILAAICWKELNKSFPVHLKFCIEGEEESQSMGLEKKMPELPWLRSDYLLVVDFDQFTRGVPAISLGCRGILSLEVSLTGSNMDLHSGQYGGIAYNPNRALVELLAKIWDSEGKILIPGFYDDVEEASKKEKEIFSVRYDKSYYTKQFGIEAFGGEKGRDLRDANYFRPTLELNGIFGGYTGVGIKTVIPASAHAKISCRLVPHQDPQKISHLIAEFLQKNAVKGMKVHVVQHGGEPAFRGNLHSKLVAAVDAASTEVTGVKCKYLLSGASIPIVPKLVRWSGAEVVGIGCGLLEDEIHAPNEHFDMQRLEQGFLTVGRMISLL